MRRLEGKKVVITGASSGVGYAAVRAFAQAGADVALLARNRSGLVRAGDSVRSAGGRAFALPVDVADREAVERAVAEAADRLGGIDVLVISAGATVFGPFREVSADDFDRVTAVTYTGAVNAVRAALPELERSAGTIVATGSVMTKVPLPTFSSYAAAKHALRGFLGTLRVELRADGSPVKVAMVHPGPVDTPLWRTVTSATGRLPRTPPLAYPSARIADALVDAAVRPRAETTVGIDSKAMELLYTAARPVGDLALLGVHLWYASGTRPAARPGSLWQPTGAGAESGGLVGRPTLRGALRVAGAPLTALGLGRPGSAPSVPPTAGSDAAARFADRGGRAPDEPAGGHRSNGARGSGPPRPVSLR